jgi:hypothetical protein
MQGIPGLTPPHLPLARRQNLNLQRMLSESNNNSARRGGTGTAGMAANNLGPRSPALSNLSGGSGGGNSSGQMVSRCHQVSPRSALTSGARSFKFRKPTGARRSRRCTGSRCTAWVASRLPATRRWAGTARRVCQ